MHGPTSRSSRRGLLTGAALATGMFLAAPTVYPAPPDSGTIANPSQPPCANIIGSPALPKEATLVRDPANGTLKRLQAGDLSSVLETTNAQFQQWRRKNREGEIALCFLQAYAGLFRLDFPYQELRVALIDLEESGFTHVRLEQYFADLPVRDGQIMVHINPQKQVYLVEGRYYPTPAQLSIRPRLTPVQATATARESLATDIGAARSDLATFSWTPGFSSGHPLLKFPG